MVSEPFKYISEKAWPDQPFEIVHRIWGLENLRS